MSGYVEASCESTSGFTTADLRIADFEITGDNRLALELRNTAPDPIEVTSVNIEDSSSGLKFSQTRELAVGAASTVQTQPGVHSSEECNQFDITINYDMPQIQNQIITGTLTNRMEIS